MTDKKTPAQLRRRIALLEAQNAELLKRCNEALRTWGDMAMEKIIAQERIKNALAILTGEDEK